MKEHTDEGVFETTGCTPLVSSDISIMADDHWAPGISKCCHRWMEENVLIIYYIYKSDIDIIIRCY